jgi:small-conductance mechanosensitive channel
LEAQAAASPRVLADPPPGVGIARFAPDGFELELGFWIGDPENGSGGVVADVNKRIYELIRNSDIQLGHPAVDTRLLDAHIASVVARIAQTNVNS